MRACTRMCRYGVGARSRYQPDASSSNHVGRLRARMPVPPRARGLRRQRGASDVATAAAVAHAADERHRRTASEPDRSTTRRNHNPTYAPRLLLSDFCRTFGTSGHVEPHTFTTKGALGLAGNDFLPGGINLERLSKTKSLTKEGFGPGIPGGGSVEPSSTSWQPADSRALMVESERARQALGRVHPRHQPGSL
jgi:hypothetical protein